MANFPLLRSTYDLDLMKLLQQLDDLKAKPDKTVTQQLVAKYYESCFDRIRPIHECNNYTFKQVNII